MMETYIAWAATAVGLGVIITVALSDEKAKEAKKNVLPNALVIALLCICAAIGISAIIFSDYFLEIPLGPYVCAVLSNSLAAGFLFSKLIRAKK